MAAAVSYDQPNVHQNLVFRFLLGEIVGVVRAARRMHPDRLAELVHGGEERLELRVVERPLVDVGIDLHTERAELVDGALGLARTGIRRGQRDLRHPPGEMVRTLTAQIGEAVIDDARILVDLVGGGHALERRLRIGQDLRIVRKGVDHLQPYVEIVDRGHLAHALADVPVVAGHQDIVEELLRDEVRIGIETHGPILRCGAGAPGACAPRACTPGARAKRGRLLTDSRWAVNTRTALRRAFPQRTGSHQ